MLTLERVTAGYGEVPVVHEVSLEVGVALAGRPNNEVGAAQVHGRLRVVLGDQSHPVALRAGRPGDPDRGVWDDLDAPGRAALCLVLHREQQARLEVRDGGVVRRDLVAEGLRAHVARRMDRRRARLPP